MNDLFSHLQKIRLTFLVSSHLQKKCIHPVDTQAVHFWKITHFESFLMSHYFLYIIIQYNTIILYFIISWNIPQPPCDLPNDPHPKLTPTARNPSPNILR